MQLRSFSGLFFATTLVISAHLSFAQALPQPLPRPLPLHAPLQDKDFYLLSTLEKDSAVRSTLASNLAELSAERQRSLAFALRTCKDEAVCILKSLLWTDEEIRAASFALTRAYKNSASLRNLVDTQLRPSGAYVLYGNQSGASLLVNAWEICARGLNDVISVYGQGAAPRYPLIDTVSFDIRSAAFQQQIRGITQQLSSETTPPETFFSPSLKAALELLALNHRDEAGRLEPMESTVNAAALKAIASTAWNRFPYSVIVVPGAGPSDPNTALSASGRKRTELAVDAYHAGKAPFILVSGGYVHPAQTRFAEAIEMEKALLEDFHIPASAILVDPHARHTTTNMRNAAREIFRYNMPMSKPALVVSDASQISYIASQTFSDRCLRELGYLPYRVLSQPSEISLVFLPSLDSLQQDPLDPLDP